MNTNISTSSDPGGADDGTFGPSTERGRAHDAGSPRPGLERIPQLRRLGAARAAAPVRPRLIPRGLWPALADYPLLTTASTLEAASTLADLLGPCRIEADDGFEATVNAVALGGLALAHVDIRGAARIDVPETTDMVGVHMHTWNQSECVVGTTRVSASPIAAIVSSPRSRLRIEFGSDGGSQLIVRIERDHVERSIARMLGRRLHEIVGFDPVLDLTTPRAVRWNIAMQLLSAELLDPESLLRRGSGLDELEDLLVTSLVLLQPSNYSGALPVRTGAKDLVRLALDWIDEHLGESIGTSTIADAMHVSPRALQQAFAAALGQTPTEVVRELRLQRVRSDLLGASAADGLTVTAAAQRWGFAHLGDFAVRYRRRFGETPSRTLRGR